MKGELGIDTDCVMPVETFSKRNVLKHYGQFSPANRGC